MMQNKKCLLFKNAQVVSDGKVQSKDVVVFRDKFVKTPPKGCEIIEVDCEGRYLMPGFIDIHVHGGGNCDFMDGNPASVRTVALTHLAHGTTTMMPTLLTASHEEILAALAAYNAATEQDALLRSIFYGVHMEGPYLSKNQKGAQDESYIKDFTGREYEIYYHLCREIKRWSIAPEVKGLEEQGYHSKWKIIEEKERKTILTNDLELHILEIPKIKVEGIEITDLIKWLKFIDNPKSKEVEGYMKENVAIKEANEKLDKMLEDEHLRKIAEWREMAIIEENSMKKSAYRKGEENGKKLGEAIGEARGKQLGVVEGERKKQREIAKKMKKLKIEIKTIESITGLTKNAKSFI